MMNKSSNNRFSHLKTHEDFKRAWEGDDIVGEHGIADLLIEAVNQKQTAFLAEYLKEKSGGWSLAPTDSLLFMAINTQQDLLLKLIAEKYPEILEQTNQEGWHPLTIAIREGTTEAVKILLDAGANPNNSNKGFTGPLAHTVACSYCKETTWLLEKGAKIDPTPGKDFTLWTIAQKEDIISILLDFETNPFEKDNAGKNALHYICERGLTAKLETFIHGRGMDTNEKDNHGNTPLILAATYGRLRVCEILINMGADVTALNKDGKSAEILIDDGFKFSADDETYAKSDLDNIKRLLASSKMRALETMMPDINPDVSPPSRLRSKL